MPDFTDNELFCLRELAFHAYARDLGELEAARRNGMKFDSLLEARVSRARSLWSKVDDVYCLVSRG